MPLRNPGLDYGVACGVVKRVEGSVAMGLGVVRSRLPPRVWVCTQRAAGAVEEPWVQCLCRGCGGSTAGAGPVSRVAVTMVDVRFCMPLVRFRESRVRRGSVSHGCCCWCRGYDGRCREGDRD